MKFFDGESQIHAVTYRIQEKDKNPNNSRQNSKDAHPLTQALLTRFPRY